MALTANDAITLLEKARDNDRLAHAYLITGAPGSGKRALTEGLCRLLIGETANPLSHPDVHSIEPESKSRRIVTEQVRDLEKQLQMRSSQGGRKVGIIFDADRLQPQASNAFLKTLEEPPKHSHLLLVTALPDQLLETILSRCIEIPLHSKDKVPLSSHQESLLNALSASARTGNPGLVGVFGFVRAFQQLLSAAKESIQAQGDAELKVEEVRYKNIADPKWFEEREDYYKALTESRYVGERNRLLDTLELWWADILRQQTTSPAGTGSSEVHLDLPQVAEVTSRLATRYKPAETLKRSDALESLRDQLRNPGINEQLAIEVAFLKAFGE